MIKVALVDDHDLIRTAIKRILHDVKGLEVVGEAASGEAAVLLAKQLAPDVMIMDVQMAGIGGLEACRKIVRQNLDIKILILTMYASEPYPSLLYQAGASGYLTKNCTPEEIIHAIRVVHAGQLHINAKIAQQIASSTSTKSNRSLIDLLSARELQILLMITQGLSVQDISKRLYLSPKTIHSNRYSILKKLGVRTNVELTLLAMHLGIIEYAEIDSK